MKTQMTNAHSLSKRTALKGTMGMNSNTQQRHNRFPELTVGFVNRVFTQVVAAHADQCPGLCDLPDPNNQDLAPALQSLLA